MGIGKIQYRKTYNFTHRTYSRPLPAITGRHLPTITTYIRTTYVPLPVMVRWWGNLWYVVVSEKWLCWARPGTIGRSCREKYQQQIRQNKNGTSDKMWSPGGQDFSSSITDFVTSKMSHTIFLCKFCDFEIAFRMSWSEGSFSRIGFGVLSR